MKILPNSGPLVAVLLIEDNPADAEMVKIHLETSLDAVFEVTHIERMRAVSSIVQTNRFDIIVADLGLPDSAGPKTVETLRQLAPGIPVVVMTGSDREDDRLAALRLGAVDFIEKSGTLKSTVPKVLLYALARAQHQTRILDIVDSNSDASVVVDLKGDILFVNRAAVSLFGRKHEEMVGSHFGFPMTGRDPVELELLGVDGLVRTAEMRVVGIDWGGQGGYLASIRDITDSKRAAELERRLIHADRLASIGQLAAGVAHEINNPAAYIQTNCAMLGEDIAAIMEALVTVKAALAEAHGPEVGVAFDAALEAQNVHRRLSDMSEMVGDCASGIRRIGATVKDLSTFSRIDCDEIETVNLNDLVTVACKLVRNELRHRAILTVDLGEVPPIAVDRAKMTQVFVNLLVNAAHSIEEGRSDENTVSITTSTRADEILVAVEDSGSGIPDEHLSRLFEPFFTTKERDRGTGLGLPLAAETVRKHGGEISVESKLGIGSRFLVRLPEDTGLRSTEAPVVMEPVEPRLGRRARLLVVDDEPLLRKALRRVLGGHDVTEADSGATALEILKRDRSFDLIISDLMMPGMDGAELFCSLLEIDEELAARMIFVTGGAITKKSREFLAKHKPPLLEKPVPRERLLRMISSLVD